MYSINGDNITLTQGDAFYADINITENGQPYTPAQGETVEFSLKRFYEEDPILTKDVTSLSLYLSTAETEALYPREYKYAVDLIRASGDHATFLQGTLTVTPDA